MKPGYLVTIRAFLDCAEDDLQSMLKASKILEDAAAQMKAAGFGSLDVTTKFVRGRRSKAEGKVELLDLEDKIDEAAE